MSVSDELPKNETGRDDCGYRYYVLLTLTLVYTLNYLDRGVMGLLLQPIKEDLHLSDTQLGLLTGIAFGLFYATLGLPIARFADRGNRVTITSVAIGLWGITVMACLFVGNFAQLLVARIAAATGEAGCMPPTYSLLGDYFPGPSDRIRAMSVYNTAGPLSALTSFMVAGWLNERYGWRVTFFVIGIPALMVAILVRMTIKEPRLRPERATRISERNTPPVLSVLAALFHQRSSKHLCIALILLWTMGAGLLPWYAAFMIRSHAMGTTELGVWMGLIFGFGGLAGILLGGYIAGRWFANDEGAQMRLSAATVALLVPFYVLFLLLPQKHQALLVLIPLIVISNLIFAPIFALMQRLVQDEMRATMLAIVMLLANLIGMGLGPQIVGILSDLLVPIARSDSLRYAMLTMSLVALWSAYHFWQAGHTVRKDLLAIASTPDRQWAD